MFLLTYLTYLTKQKYETCVSANLNRECLLKISEKNNKKAIIKKEKKTSVKHVKGYSLYFLGTVLIIIIFNLGCCFSLMIGNYFLLDMSTWFRQIANINSLTCIANVNLHFSFPWKPMVVFQNARNILNIVPGP